MGVTPTFGRFLAGQSACVTGASRGIGAEIAVALAEAGANIVGVARSWAALESTGERVRAAGGEFIAVPTELGDRDSLYRAVDHVITLGSPNVLVHAAGINRRAPIIDHSDNLWDEVRAVNLDAPFILSREFGHGMLARGSGKVVFLASLLSFQGGMNVPGYSSTKGAIAQLTKSLANEWASCGVNVNAVAPGYVVTDMNEALVGDPLRDRQITERIPAGRWAQPSDVAGAVIFLVSPAATYIHGVTLPVDGGWLGR